MVSVQDALRIGFVTLVFMFPTLLGFAFLIVPGSICSADGSQVTLALIDGRAQWLDAGDASSGLTAGFRPAILIVLLTVATATLVVEYLISDVTYLTWIYSAVGSAVGAALASAMYYELSRRRPLGARRRIEEEPMRMTRVIVGVWDGRSSSRHGFGRCSWGAFSRASRRRHRPSWLCARHPSTRRPPRFGRAAGRKFRRAASSIRSSRRFPILAPVKPGVMPKRLATRTDR
jgi:hypothetical protein